MEVHIRDQSQNLTVVYGAHSAHQEGGDVRVLWPDDIMADAKVFKDSYLEASVQTMTKDNSAIATDLADDARDPDVTVFFAETKQLPSEFDVLNSIDYRDSINIVV